MLILSCLFQTKSRADTAIDTFTSWSSGGTNYNVFVETAVITNIDGTGATIFGPLLSVTDRTNNIPFTSPGSPLFQIYSFTVNVPANVLTNNVTLTWTNYSTNVDIVTSPLFLNYPQSQSAFVSNTVTFSAPAVHTSGYQWQFNGTNLVESSHFIGVTNSTLTISNVQLADTGDYAVIASHPIGPATASAALSVYKPIELGLGAWPSGGGFTLLVANCDGSPFEPQRIPNLQVYSATNLDSETSTWNLETNTGSISNGTLQIAFPDDGSSSKFWRVREQ